MRRTRAFWALPVLLAACGDGDGGTRPAALTRAEVADIYAVCALSFVPDGVLPPVDIRSAAFELDNPQVSHPRLGLEGTGTFEMEYTPKGQNTDRELPGSFDTSGTDQVELRFANPTAVASILLPDRLVLRFQAGTKTLSTGANPQYTVPRSDYARLAGVSESGLAERIPGRLAARFAAGGGGCVP